MKLIEVLEKENSKAMCNRIVTLIGKNPTRFAELLDLFLDGNAKVRQRASWPLSLCVETYPTLAHPHLKAIVRNLRRSDLHDAVRRSTMRLLQFVPIPKSLQAEVTNRCFSFLSDSKETIGVKVFSMTVLLNLTQYFPDLSGELRIVLEDQLPYASPGYASRARKVLAQLAD